MRYRLRRDSRQLLDACLVKNLSVNEAALELEGLDLVGVFLKDLRRCDRIFIRDSDSGHALENLLRSPYPAFSQALPVMVFL